MGIFKKLKKAISKNDNYLDRDFYFENILNNYKHLDAYFSLLRLENKNKITTTVPIAYFSNYDLHNSKEYFIKKYGKPDHTAINHFEIGKIKILFYRTHLSNQKVKLELHFLNKRLIMVSYTFSHLDHNSEKQHPLDVLQQKYLVEKEITPSDHYIEDPNKAKIVIMDSVEFKVYYLHNTLQELMNSKLKKGIISTNYPDISDEKNLFEEL
ncbi:MAG: hypothetical protein CMB99_01885 [Flavobacteriaceae bacterium]|nr:hypothetical protein [Flavobacteriaceae bacterium]|tara:strand:- start:26327 stop:26959 length:633 start_codon:yes stop_codon:yes gene_type:complete